MLLLKQTSLTLDKDPNFANTLKPAVQCSLNFFTVQSIQMKERARTVVIENPKIEACNCKNPIIEACKMQKPYNYNFSIRPTSYHQQIKANLTHITK